MNPKGPGFKEVGNRTEVLPFSSEPSSITAISTKRSCIFETLGMIGDLAICTNNLSYEAMWFIGTTEISRIFLHVRAIDDTV